VERDEFNFTGEQFWGRAARASRTRKSLGTLVILGEKLSEVSGRNTNMANSVKSRAWFVAHGSSHLLHSVQRNLKIEIFLREKLEKKWRGRTGGLELRSRKLVRRDGEIDGDLGLRFHGLAALVVRLEVPLPHRILRRGGQNRRSADHAQILNRPVFADQGL
jgi:hypothetical protein